MNQLTQNYDIYNAIKSLDTETKNHNATFDEANKIFSDVEEGLQNINIDHWYPYNLFTRIPSQTDSIPNLLPINTLFSPFETTSYQIGYISKRLVARTIITKYDYVRDTYGNVMYGPNGIPYTNKLSDDISDPFPVADSSREIRVMVIECLPGFIEFVRSSIAIHTQTLNSALGNICTY